MPGVCPACGKPILPTAETCPHCGASADARPLVRPEDRAPALVEDPAEAALAPHEPLRPPGRVGPAVPRSEGPAPRPWIAALLSALFPGAGQAYTGHIGAGVALALTWWLVPVLSNVLAAIHAAGAAHRATRELREPRGEWAVAIPAFQILIQAPLLVLFGTFLVGLVLAPKALREADKWAAGQLPNPSGVGGTLEAGEEKATKIAGGPESQAGTAPGAPSGPAGALPIETRNRLTAGVVFLLADSGKGWIGEGTGAIVSEDGLVVTNSHVTSYGKSARIGAVLASGTPQARIVSATVVWAGAKPEEAAQGQPVTMESLSADLALLQLDIGSERLTPLSLGRSEDVVETAEVLAIGFPLGTDLQANASGPAPSFAKGNITRIQKDSQGRTILLEHSAPILEGYSGGPLVTTAGLVVGINAGVAGGKVAGAVPAERVTEILRQAR